MKPIGEDDDEALCPVVDPAVVEPFVVEPVAVCDSVVDAVVLFELDDLDFDPLAVVED